MLLLFVFMLARYSFRGIRVSATSSLSRKMAMQHAPAPGSISANICAVRDKVGIFLIIRLLTLAQIVRASQGHKDVSTVRLVAVSKLKPVAAIQEAYAAGQRVFGENYVGVHACLSS